MKILFIINRIILWIELAVLGLCAFYLMYDQYIGSVAAERLLEKLRIPLAYYQVFIIIVIFAALTIVTVIIDRKLRNR